ncbi:MAG: SprB repeat-containing protein, partial [Bacteroidota bacterium]
MYKLFALPLLLCIGGFFISATGTNNNETKETTSFDSLAEYDLSCMNVELNTQAVRCFGFCDGVLEVVVTGGQEPYTYQWSNGLTTNFSATLPAGEFTVTVIDAAGCEVVATSTVGSPAEIKPNLEIGGSCDENTPIVASVSPIGGVGNYNIEWSTGETGRSISNLVAGQTYGVTITTGGNGCSVSEEFTVAEGLTISTDQTDIACGTPNTGSATATALSGRSPYTFQWSNGFSETNDGSSTIENIDAGSYSVTVTDSNGCETIETIEVADDGGLNLDIDSAPTTCKGDNDGMANVIPSGGTAPYVYFWSDGQTTGSA